MDKAVNILSFVLSSTETLKRYEVRNVISIWYCITHTSAKLMRQLTNNMAIYKKDRRLDL